MEELDLACDLKNHIWAPPVLDGFSVSAGLIEAGYHHIKFIMIIRSQICDLALANLNEAAGENGFKA